MSQLVWQNLKTVDTFPSSPDVLCHIAQSYDRLGLSKLLYIYCSQWTQPGDSLDWNCWEAGCGQRIRKRLQLEVNSRGHMWNLSTLRSAGAETLWLTQVKPGHSHNRGCTYTICGHLCARPADDPHRLFVHWHWDIWACEHDRRRPTFRWECPSSHSGVAAAGRTAFLCQ